MATAQDIINRFPSTGGTTFAPGGATVNPSLPTALTPAQVQALLGLSSTIPGSFIPGVGANNPALSPNAAGAPIINVTIHNPVMNNSSDVNKIATQLTNVLRQTAGQLKF